MIKSPELHNVMVYSQSPYATVAVDGKQINGVCSVHFSAEAGKTCMVTLKLLTNHVTIKGKAAVETNRNTEKGNQLKRGDKIYQVVSADDEIFVIGEVHGASVDYDNLEAYPNDTSVNTLKELNFERV